MKTLVDFRPVPLIRRDVAEDDVLEGAATYIQALAGFISVWEDPADGRIYVVDGHRRLRLAKRLSVALVYVQFLEVECEADAFAYGVILNAAQWAFEPDDKFLWALASRRAAVEQALHSGWLDAHGTLALRLYRHYYPDLGRRYCSWPEGKWEEKIS